MCQRRSAAYGQQCRCQDIHTYISLLCTSEQFSLVNKLPKENPKKLVQYNCRDGAGDVVAKRVLHVIPRG